MPKEFIVAIELGSSKMTGIAGQKNLDGSITVLALVEEDSSSCIRKGVIYNIDKTCQSLTNIINKLKTILKQDISQVYVGVGGRSIKSVKNIIVKDLPTATIITQEMINELMDINRNMTYPDQEILDAATQEYKIDNQYQIDPVGIPIAEMYLAPLAMADSVLTDSEKRAGCALIDLGADTTTVSVYYKNILRHLSVIPLGGNNITKDLTCLQIEEQEAEKMKLKYAKAYTDVKNIDPTLNYSIDKDRVVESKKFIEIVEARVEEIVENAWYQVPIEFADKLLGGIIITGGGSNMPEIEKVFRNHTNTPKIRFAKFVTQTVKAKDAKINNHDGTMNTILGLLAKGDMNCSGDEISNDLFTNNMERHLAADSTPKVSRNPNETAGTGVVPTPAQKREEELRKKKEEEERLAKIAEEEEKEREEKKRKENSFLHKGFRKLKDFFLDTISEEE